MLFRSSILPEQPSMDDGGDNTAEPCVNVIDILSLCIPSLLPYSYVSHNKSQHFRFSVRLKDIIKSPFNTNKDHTTDCCFIGPASISSA